jgi:hypothetical protein
VSGDKMKYKHHQMSDTIIKSGSGGGSVVLCIVT